MGDWKKRSWKYSNFRVKKLIFFLPPSLLHTFSSSPFLGCNSKSTKWGSMDGSFLTILCRSLSHTVHELTSFSCLHWIDSFNCLVNFGGSFYCFSHVVQVVAVAVFLALGFAFYVFFAPFVGRKQVQYIVIGLYTPLVSAFLFFPSLIISWSTYFLPLISLLELRSVISLLGVFRLCFILVLAISFTLIFSPFSRRFSFLFSLYLFYAVVEGCWTAFPWDHEFCF